MDIRTSEVNSKILREIMHNAQFSPKKRARVCLHEDDDSDIHVMLISLDKQSVIPTHKHSDRPEFYILLNGHVRISIFAENGLVDRTIELEYPSETKIFTFYMPKGVWHSLQVLSESCLVLEVTSGPFKRSATEMRG